MTSYRRRGAHAAPRPGPALFGTAGRALRPPAGWRAPGRERIGGQRVSRWRFGTGRLRPSLPRVVAVTLAAAFVVAGVVGGWSSSPSAEPTAQAFLLDWQQHAYRAAAALTTGRQAVVAAELAGAYRGLDAAAFYLSMGHISQRGRSAQAHFYASVDLSQDGAPVPWDYQGRFWLHQTGSGWKVAWSPEVIAPGLRPGLHLAVVSTAPHRMPLLDSAGKPLLTPSLAYVIGVRPRQLAHPAVTAAGLGRVTGLEPGELLGWIQAAPPGRFSELVMLRPAQYHRLAGRLRQVPGLIIRPERLRLFTSIAPAVVGSVGTEVSPALLDQGIGYRPGATIGLSGLQRAYQAKLAGTPTTMVITENAAGQRVAVLKSWPGRAPVAVRTTLNAGVQQAANRAVGSAPGSAALVAVQAATGRILAVAEHWRAGLPRINPLAGRYPPGAAFTIVSGEALLASGLGPGRPVPCRSINVVGGQSFRNIPAWSWAGARPTFAADFAHACLTAFSGLSQRLTGRGLLAAARGFGLGGSWRLPLPSFSGLVGAAGSAAQLASDTVGEGSVLVSPLAMALVAAQVDTGAWHQPTLVAQGADPAGARQLPFTAASLGTLRGLMRLAVRSGAARRANLAGTPVYGQVGTAALGSGKHRTWASWFVGYRGGTAFSVLEISASPRTSAALVAARFLRLARGG
jgi:cell division protein FtsI/penicillin-binding protein 2